MATSSFRIEDLPEAEILTDDALAIVTGGKMSEPKGPIYSTARRGGQSDPAGAVLT
ncbi:hypothetical protein HS041_03675 [Planomonospora sp. ID67723]|uniref:hypothetical protein n=1 Tax=Planomonospora sp. ID67723 TaxID=2738134 RepID=UPI0018C43E02|nr:hypothetical protein [Planomonospora sp. ID67723]MBG0826872.1 hypothetical protein [Planomonospora sp. ID67723]